MSTPTPPDASCPPIEPPPPPASPTTASPEALTTSFAIGYIRGLTAGARHALRSVLELHFTPLPTDAAVRIDAADLPALRAWLLHAVRAGGSAAALHPPPGAGEPPTQPPQEPAG